MSHSTLIDWDHSLNEWIKDGFPKWFMENIVIPEDIEEDNYLLSINILMSHSTLIDWDRSLNEWI